MVDLIIVGLYFAVGMALQYRAMRELKDPNKLRTYTPMYDADEFTPGGDGPRRVALRFWWVGGIATAVLLWILQ